MSIPLPNPSCPCEPPVEVCCSESPVPAILSLDILDVTGCPCLMGFPTTTLTHSGGHWTGSAAWGCGGTVNIDLACVPEACVWAIGFAFDCGSGLGSFALNTQSASLPIVFDSGNPSSAPELADCCGSNSYSFTVRVQP
jgi:hypothetical protein